MGNFYTNITLKCPRREEIISELRRLRRKAFVGPTENGSTVICDEVCDRQNPVALGELARELSRALRCTTLSVLNHDDHILWYQAHKDGCVVDEYDSTPGYFDAEAESSAPIGGSAGALCSALDVAERSEQVEPILRRPSFGEGGYSVESQRHRDLVEALGLPAYAVGVGYNHLTGGERAAAESTAGWTRVG